MGLKSWQRKKLIQEKLEKDGQVSVVDLASQLGVSEVTVRHDLNALSQEGALIRTYGGAVCQEVNISPEYFFEAKLRRHHRAKKAIATLAINLIRPGEIVFLDTGTTTLEIARLLSRRNRELTVATSSLPIVSLLLKNQSIRLLLLGGFVRKQLYDVSGPGTINQIQQLFFHQCFLGVDGLSPEKGLTTTDPETAALEEAVMNQSRVINIVADSSKIGRVSLLPYGNIFQREGERRLITDSAASAAELKAFQKVGFKVIVAKIRRSNDQQKFQKA
ncbi:MAG: DeoR/GlpR family DNA-binding transcription regulator [Candidatus Omnitrophica bacterium]|nr:DeoR/GlpR family DNA-binding transcription regulator [Candidatus Omnitrophota bacterium]